MVKYYNPEVNLHAVRTFYDPHPGNELGAGAPLPAAIKRAVDELSGKRMTVKKAVERIQSVTRGLVEARETAIFGVGWIAVEVCAGRVYPRRRWTVIYYY